MACSSCGRDTELRAGADGALYCGDCVVLSACHECEKCFQRVCGVYACPFCLAAPSPDVSLFNKRLRAQPIRIEEMERAFILRGKALCKSCLLYEQDRWEIVPGKPGKGGARVKIVLHKSAIAQDKDREVTRIGKRLFHSIGIHPAKPPPDPLKEGRMLDDACKSCDDEKNGKRRRKLVGFFRVKNPKPI
jgi:hypothetical protein